MWYCKGRILLKLIFFNLICIFLPKIAYNFFTKIDISARQNWLKLKFCPFETVIKQSFYNYLEYRGSIWKIAKVRGCCSESVHIWPYVLVKPKCIWEAVEYLKNCKQTAVKFSKIEKTYASQTHFGFTNIGSNMHRFWTTAFYFCNFSNGASYFEIEISYFQVNCCLIIGGKNSNVVEITKDIFEKNVPVRISPFFWRISQQKATIRFVLK